MRIIDEAANGARTVPCIELPAPKIAAVTSALASRILAQLASRPGGMHASQIARELREHEQKVYYHIRRLRAAGIVVVDHLEESGGGVAKVLRLAAGAAAVRFSPWERAAGRTGAADAHLRMLAPFVERGRWDARIVVSSPDPHGPEGARGRDAGYAIELGLFLGLFLESAPVDAVQLDTQLSDWKQNLIIIGGPVVNKAAQRVNARSLAPYDAARKEFRSSVTGRRYAQENAGIVAKMPNPFARGKWVLLLAGKRSAGTRAAVLALTRMLDRIAERARANGTCLCVVEGVDADSDGVVESARVLE